MKKSIIAALFAGFVLATPAAAQDWWFGLTYETSLPSGDTKDFAGGFSWRGAGFTARKLVSDNVSAGFWAAWHVMNEEGVDSASFVEDNVGTDFTGYSFRYINAFPIMLNVFYHLGRPGNTNAYIGVNGGVYYVERRTEVSVYVIDRNAWQFGLAPEVGVVTPLGWRARGFLGARYNWAASSGSSPSINYFNFFVGAAWM